MYEIRMTKTFRKDAERCRKRGYDMELLKTAIRLLEADGQLPAIYHPHKLSGQYVGTWECHLKPDWLSSGSKTIRNLYFYSQEQAHIPIYSDPII